VSDQTLDEYLSENIFEPLSMHDTSFFLDESKKHRLAPCYRWNESKYIYENINNSDNPKITDIDFFKKPFAFSGGAGLLSSTKDYQKFGNSLLDARLGKKSLLVNNNTADLMMRNYLKGGLDMAQSSFLPLAGEEYVRGVGFGLGGSVEMDQDSGEVLYFGWGGAASTLFHISPKHDYSLVFMTQVLESEVIRPLNKDIKTLIASALH
jgi:CubicO group peptidase (beta-lactamase class C family)